MTATVTKTKGHADLNDVHQGRATLESKRGNDNADTAATWGTEMHARGFHMVAGWYAKRHGKYKAFMHRIHTLIVAVLTREKELREAQHKSNKVLLGKNYHNKIEIKSSLGYGNPNNTLGI